MGEYIKEKTQKVFKMIEAQLKDRDYLLGNFSAVDTCMGYALDAVVDDGILAEYPKIKGYYDRLALRPACLKSEIFKR